MSQESSTSEVSYPEHGLDLYPDVDLDWYDSSPNTDDGECLCSWCGEMLQRDSVAIRIYNPGENLEARLHRACWNECSPQKISICDNKEEEA